jgi:competence protein ComEC
MMPETAQTPTTLDFEKLLDAIEAKGIGVINPKPLDEFSVGQVKLTAFAPNGECYDDFNNYSIVLKAVYGNKAFLFTGDAESKSENYVLDKGYDISADVLKVGHHGSKTSTSERFLAAVNPTIAVIGVGKGNSYGHPTPEILARLAERGVAVYRTDLDGIVSVTCDGERVEAHITHINQ